MDCEIVGHDTMADWAICYVGIGNDIIPAAILAGKRILTAGFQLREGAGTYPLYNDNDVRTTT